MPDPAPKRGRGRPVIGPQRNIRFPPETWDGVEAAAEADGITSSEEARRMLADAVKRRRARDRRAT